MCSNIPLFTPLKEGEFFACDVAPSNFSLKVYEHPFAMVIERWVQSVERHCSFHNGIIRKSFKIQNSAWVYIHIAC